MVRSSRLSRDSNPHGTHTKRAFRPFKSGLSVRCPGCNQLMESGFLEEVPDGEVKGRTPCCGYIFSKAVARDMYVEAMGVRTNFGGWNHAILEELAGKPPTVVSPDMMKKRLASDPVVRELTARFTEIERAKVEAMKRIRRKVA